MKRTTTIYLAKDSDGDVQVFQKKPKAFRQRRRVGGWSGNNYRNRVVTEIEGISHWDAAGSIETDALRKLIGRGVPTGKILKIQLTLNPKAGVADRVLIAAPTDAGVGLFRKQPTMTTVNRYTNAGGYEDLPTAEGGDAVFCTSGFEQGTGLSVPEDKTVRLGVTVRDLIDIPLRKKISR